MAASSSGLNDTPTSDILTVPVLASDRLGGDPTRGDGGSEEDEGSVSGASLPSYAETHGAMFSVGAEAEEMCLLPAPSTPDDGWVFDGPWEGPA